MSPYLFQSRSPPQSGRATRPHECKDAAEVIRMLAAWNEQKAKLDSGEIDKETYDQWRYHYPKFDTTGEWVKVPSQELSDAMVEAFKDRLKPD